MFIAHLPAGFLLSRYLLRKERTEPHYIKFLLIGLLFSIAPDFDLAYFHLIDNRQHPHHSYWSHIPFYWITFYAVLFVPCYTWLGKKGIRLLTVVLICGLLHMSLDSVASGIKWLYPLETGYHGIWRIPAIHDWWVANYLFHWTFLIELVITVTAVVVFYRDRELRCGLKSQLLAWLYRTRPGPGIMARLVEIYRITNKE